jgi:Clostripain family
MKNLFIIVGLSFLIFSCDDSTSNNTTCDDLECGTHGDCIEDGNLANCECHQGYSGEDCTTCAEGYQDNNEDGTCKESCATLQYDCSDHGTCNDNSGTAICDCDDPYLDSGNGNCISPNSGRTCDEPIPLELGGQAVFGSTIDAGNESSGSCANSNTGNEIIYTFTLTATRVLTFETTGFDTIIYIRKECDDFSSEIICNDDGGEGNYSRLTVTLTEGTYFFAVDSFADPGNFTLTTEVKCETGFVYDPQTKECLDDPCLPNPCTESLKTKCQVTLPDLHTCSCSPGAIVDPENNEICIVNPNPTGESCIDPIALIDATGIFEGSTIGAYSKEIGSCGGDGPERIFHFTIDQVSKVNFMTAGFDTAIYLRTQCDDPASELFCDDDEGPERGSMIDAILHPGGYFLIVDSFEDSGDFEFTWSIINDPCINEELKCPGTPLCTPNYDWSDYSCECPVNTIPHNEDCIDDPCEPNPCTAPGKGKCQADLPSSFNCLCELGYVDDPTPDSEGCISDPSAADWTVVVYLNADNNLEADGLLDMIEMEAAGSTADVNIVVLLDLYEEEGGVSRILYVNQGDSTVIANYGELDMSDWRVLRDFGIFAVDNYPARHFAFILWDHGDGWYKSSTNKSPLFKGFSNDDHGIANEISIAKGDYARAMKPIITSIGRKIDLLAFDACLMGMWEVAQATQPFADYFLASSETIPVTGFPYDLSLAPLIANPSISATEIGANIVESYFSDDTENSTLTLSDLSTMNSLTASISTFADALVANSGIYSQIETVRQSTLYFTYSEHIDLYDFANGIANLSTASTDLVTAANNLKAEIENTVLYHRAQTDFTASKGLAIYLPAQSEIMDPDYRHQQAVWSTNSTWDEFVVSFTQ